MLTLAEAAVNRKDPSLCKTSPTWLRVICSECGRNMALVSAVTRSGRPAFYVHLPKTAGCSIQRSTYAFTIGIGYR